MPRLYVVTRLIFILFFLYASNVFGQPEYHFTIGLNYSDFYGYVDVERPVYRELQESFAEQYSLRAGLELNGNITNSLSYQSGIIYRGSGTTGFNMRVLSMPILLLKHLGGLSFGGGLSPSILLSTPDYDSNQYHYPVHFLVRFRLLKDFYVSVGHLRQLNSVITINSENFESPRVIPEIDMKSHETYLSFSYRLF